MSQTDQIMQQLEYLRMKILPPEIETFQTKPSLWRSLREEADFYALDGCCSPDNDGTKGVLHWLGTNKGKEEYVNPYARGVLDVTGWFDSFDTSLLGFL